MRWMDQVTKNVPVEDMTWGTVALRGALMTSVSLLLRVAFVVFGTRVHIRWWGAGGELMLIGLAAFPGAIGGIIYRGIALAGAGYYVRWIISAVAAMLVTIGEVRQFGVAMMDPSGSWGPIVVFFGSVFGDLLLCVFAALMGWVGARYFLDW